MRRNRLVSTLMLLISRDSITAPDLASIFGVDKRTIYRDIQELKNAGVPVIATPHRKDIGMSLAPEYKEKYGLLNHEDIESLLFSLRNVKTFHLESDNDKLMKRLINYLSESSPENFDDISFIEIEIQFNKKHRAEINKLFGELMLDIDTQDNVCTAKVAFPDDKLYYDVLIRLADKCKYISPQHIRDFVMRKIKAMREVQESE